jgi:hypothetical protein
MTPIVLRDVEITSLSPFFKRITLVVHIQALPIQMRSYEVQSHISTRVRCAVKYLVDEGFIPDPLKENWQCIISSICHPPANA